MTFASMSAAPDQALAQVAEAAIASARAGERAQVVFDLDDTLFLVRPRKRVIFGDNCVQMPLVENSVVYQPPGNPTPIKRTTVLKGRVGGVENGFLTDRPSEGLTVGEMTGFLDEFRRRANAELRLAWADQNIPVIVSNIDYDADYDTSFGRPGQPLNKRVSFNAFQIDEFDSMVPEP